MYDYSRNLKWSRLRVGIIVSAVLVILFLMVTFATNLGTLFTRKTTIYADFTDVRGLKVQAPVMLSGVEIGNVARIHFQPIGIVRVSLSLDTPYLRFLKKDSQAQVNTLGLLGDKYLLLTRGTAHAGELSAGEVITGSAPPGLQGIAESGTTVLAKLSNLEQSLEHLISLIESGGGSAAKFINNPQLFDNINDSLRQLAAILDAVERGRGTLGSLVKDDALYRDLKDSAQEFRKFAMTLRTTHGSLNLLVKDRALYDTFLSAATALDNLTTKLEGSKGTLARLIEDKSLYETVNKGAQQLAVILDRLEKGEGALGGLTENGRLSRDLEQTINNLNALIEDIKAHPKKYFQFSIF